MLWTRWGRLVLGAFAPRHCAGCDAVSGGAICAGCSRALDGLDAPPPRLGRHGLLCAAYPYRDPVRSIVHRAKYGGERSAIQELTVHAAPRLLERMSAPPDLVVPVPLGRRRRRQRGFNQAAVMGSVLADAAGLPMSGRLLRIRETSTQVGRDGRQRRANIDGCFAWRGPSLAGAVVLLVDDVLTTGATAGAAVEALHLGGAGAVDTAVLAVVP